MSGGYRGSRCVFLKYFWLIVVDDSVKASHVSTSMEFMWGGESLRVPWCLIQLILDVFQPKASPFLSFSGM